VSGPAPLVGCVVPGCVEPVKVDDREVESAIALGTSGGCTAGAASTATDWSSCAATGPSAARVTPSRSTAGVRSLATSALSPSLRASVRMSSSPPLRSSMPSKALCSEIETLVPV
jgi:hypothetical protein